MLSNELEMMFIPFEKVYIPSHLFVDFSVTEKTANPCDKMKCGFAEDCFWRLDGTAKCKCNLTCNALEKRSGPVCARNGKTYADLCSMRLDQCKVKKEITVYHYGHCIQQGKQNIQHRSRKCTG